MKMNALECPSHGLDNIHTTQKTLHQIILFFYLVSKLWKVISNIILFFSQNIFFLKTFSLLKRFEGMIVALTKKSLQHMTFHKESN